MANYYLKYSSLDVFIPESLEISISMISQSLLTSLGSSSDESSTKSIRWVAGINFTGATAFLLLLRGIF